MPLSRSAFLICALLSSVWPWPSYRNLGFIAYADFPAQSPFYNRETAWPVVPAAGISYDYSFSKNVSWIFDGLYEFQSTNRTRSLDDTLPPHRYRYVDAYDSTVYELFPDEHTFSHVFHIRITPMFTAWRYLYFGLGYSASWSLERSSGFYTYHYLYPDDRWATYPIRSSSMPDLHIDQGFDVRIGVSLNKLRLDLTGGSYTDVGGYKLTLTWYPWKPWRWNEPD